MLSRREMGVLCAALLLCLLLSLGAGWAKGQLDAADALAADAKVWAASSLVRLELTAREVLAARGIRAPVHACLVNMYFPTRRYAGAALPAGRYDAVRLDIGTHRPGRNWWCVLYPGLCRSACGGYAKPEENDLVCGEYLVRFRLVEWWGEVTAPREDAVLAGGTLCPAAA